MCRNLILSAAVAAVLSHLTPFAPAAAPTTQPTRLHLYVEAEKPAESAKQLSRQLGLPVRIENDAGVIQYDSETEKPFALAVADFLTKTGLTTIDSNGLTLTRGDSYRVAPVGENAVLVLSRLSVSARQALIRNEPVNYNYDLQGTLLIDPAMRVVSVGQTLRIDSIDAGDVPIRNEQSSNFNNDTYSLINAMSGNYPTGRVSMRFSATQPVSAVRSVSARAKAWQVAEEATAEISAEDVNAGKAVEGAGLTAKASLDNRGNRSMVSLTLSGPAVDAYRDGRWQQSLGGSVTALDLNGELMALSPMGSQPGPDGKSIVLRVRPQNDPATFFSELGVLRVRVPTKVKVIDLPIEIKDLPIRSN